MEKKPYISPYQVPEKPFMAAGLFANSHPIEIEIGCGKGKFLLGRAQTTPEVNFIGLDWARKWLGLAEERGMKKNLPNLIFIRTHAAEWVRALGDSQISVFHIYFPDPWPKKRHHKRRIFQADFLAQMRQVLIPGGVIEFATDHAGYWEHVQTVVHEHCHEWTDIKMGGQRTAYPEFRTNYELKYAAQGRPLYYLEMRKPL